MTKPRTLFDKIWESHLVNVQDDGTCLIYIDRHLIHEVTSPQAFEGLRATGRKVRRANLTLAVADHNVPTTDRSQGIDDEDSRIQIEALTKNCAEFGVELFAPENRIAAISGMAEIFRLGHFGDVAAHHIAVSTEATARQDQCPACHPLRATVGPAKAAAQDPAACVGI